MSSTSSTSESNPSSRRNSNNSNNNIVQSSKKGPSTALSGGPFASTPASVPSNLPSRRAVVADVEKFSTQTERKSNGNLAGTADTSLRSSPNSSLLSDMFESPIASHAKDQNLMQSIVNEPDINNREQMKPELQTNTVRRRKALNGEKIKDVKPHTAVPSSSLELANDFKLNKAKSLVDSLRILKCIADLDQRDVQIVQSERPGSKQQGTKSNTNILGFQFTETMFKSNSSEAFTQITHFLFGRMNTAETATRFIGAWPIYERHQEGLYRRIASKWFKEIVGGNPKFFSKKVKVEQLDGLVVNPSGDRFIRFLHCFVDFVMFKVTDSEGTETIEDPILQKMVKHPVQNVFTLQQKILSCRLNKLAKIARAEQICSLEERIMSEATIKRMETLQQESEIAVMKRVEGVSRLIKMKPQYFPIDAQELLQTQAIFFQKELKRIPIENLPAARDEVQSPLNEYVDNLWKSTLESFVEKIEGLETFFSKFSRLWLLVKASSKNSGKLVPVSSALAHLQKLGKQQSLSSVLQEYAKLVGDFLNNLEGTPLSDSIIVQKRFIDTKLMLMKQKCDDINQVEVANIATMMKKANFEIQTLSVELEDVDWSKLSKCYDQPLSNTFSFSPPRIVDKHKQTGFTPALSSYLPSHASKLNKLTGHSSLISNSGHSQSQSETGEEETQRSRSRPAGPSGISRAGILKQLSSETNFQPGKKKIQNFFAVSDSPVSHLSQCTSVERKKLLQNLNVSSRGSIPKISLMPEDNVNPTLGMYSFPTPSIEQKSRNALPWSGTAARQSQAFSTGPSSSQSIEDKLHAVMKSLALPTFTEEKETLSDTKRQHGRRRSLNVHGNRDDKHEISMNQSKIMEGLEGKLGILDISVSYADSFLKSIGSDSSDSEA